MSNETKIHLSDQELATAAVGLNAILNSAQQMKSAVPLLEQLANGVIESHEVVASLLAAEILEDNPPPAQPEPDTPVLEDEPALDPDFFEGDPFETGGAYDWLPDRYELGDAPIWLREIVGGNVLDVRDDSLEPMPVTNDNRMLVGAGWNSDIFVYCNDLDAHGKRQANRQRVGGYGSFGPLWWARVYNAIGAIRDNYLWRVGDFVNGREGHVIYANAAASNQVPEFAIDGLVGVQHGAQLVQACFRTTETQLEPDHYPEAIAGSKLRLARLASIDGGVIDLREGYQLNAVRASWPITVFVTGHETVEVDEVYIRSSLDVPFKHSTKGLSRAHGALLIASSNRREIASQQATVNNFDVEVTDSDRSQIRIGDVTEARIDAGRMREHGRQNGIAVLSSVERFEITPHFDWGGQIRVFSTDKPYNSPIAVFPHVGGTTTIIEPKELAS